MKFKRLGSTDMDVSIVGLGTVKLGRNKEVKYPQAFDIPNDRQVVQLLNAAAESGINLLDTAPAYGYSEQRLGELLPKSMAHDWLICTKVGESFDSHTGLSNFDFRPEFIRSSIEQSCQHLKREVLDLVLVHSDGQDKKIIQDYGVLDVLQTLKSEGTIKSYGMSTKTLEGGLLALQQCDVVMVTHNLDYQEELAVIEQAERDKKGILIKKALSSGHLVTGAADVTIFDSLKSIYQCKGVSSVILGSISVDHIIENAKIAVDAFAASISSQSH